MEYFRIIYSSNLYYNWLPVRTIQVDAYYVAGRQVPTVFNGMATAADWMSGASFVAMAGEYISSYGYMALLVGWTGGYFSCITTSTM